MTGTVYWGINNIYRVRDSDGNYSECRIKGKILADEEEVYNPLAPGDRVELSLTGPGRGLISQRLDRHSQFSRWNKKREVWQTIAANPDLILVLSSVESPSFNPRFVDRVLISTFDRNVPVAILISKTDLGIQPWIEERIAAWTGIGIEVFRCSARTGEGIDDLKNSLSTRTVVFFGPSGTGKSSTINCLLPGLDLPTREISRKYNRGRHMTNFAQLIDTPWGGRLIDSPGVRDLAIHGIPLTEFAYRFPEIARLDPGCRFQPCMHQHEPDCAVIAGVKQGLIHPDRYDNYIKIHSELRKKLEGK